MIIEQVLCTSLCVRHMDTKANAMGPCFQRVHSLSKEIDTYQCTCGQKQKRANIVIMIT